MDDRFNESIMTHGWPECGAGRIDIEELYQLFKERLLREMKPSGNAVPPDHEYDEHGKCKWCPDVNGTDRRT